MVEGDAKLYEILQAIKFEYGQEYKWLLPLPGDWHLLKNFQIAIMKPYFDTGLKEVARVSGYPVAAIQFILEAWEAMYQVMVQKFLQYCEKAEKPIAKEVTDIVTKAIDKAINNEDSAACLISGVHHSFSELKHFTSFTQFVEEISKKNSTWKFWAQFVLKDALQYIALQYIALYIAIRSGNWDLRVASLKMMAPIFSAFDHFTCKKVIAQHLADINILPSDMLSNLKQGCFSVSLTGRGVHGTQLQWMKPMKWTLIKKEKWQWYGQQGKISIDIPITHLFELNA